VSYSFLPEEEAPKQGSFGNERERDRLEFYGIL
jgi:hypothetical protein